MKYFNRGELVYIPIHGHIARILSIINGAKCFYYNIQVLNDSEYDLVFCVEDTIIEKLPYIYNVEIAYLKGAIV